MTRIDDPTNPFASHRTQPGAIPFRFPAGTNLASVVAQLRDCNYRCQIVGPHGSGKSTLLATLLPELEAQGIAARSIALHNRQRHLPADCLQDEANARPCIFVIDGYEQLSVYSRLKLRWHCWRQGWGLLITTHVKAARLPVLISLAPTLELTRELLDRLLAEKKGTFYFSSADFDPSVSSENKVECPLVRQAELSFSRHAGNLREVWFDLYDRHERQVREKAACRVLPRAGE